MDQLSMRSIFESCRQLIISDLHGDVTNELLERKVINDDEYKAINYLENQEQKNEKLLDILIEKSDVLDQFMEALKTWYSWIEYDLRTQYEKAQKWKEAIASTKAIPRQNVSRSALLNQVRKCLRQLKRGHYVVIHGMSGCGKSSLAAEALHDEILVDKFKGKVHWLSCGQDANSKNEDQILGLQMELYGRICDDETANMDDLKTANVKTLHTQLFKRFETSDFKGGLIVLDDVHSAEVIEALNINCKTLVTTPDQNVMKNLGDRYIPIKVDEGFTEEESLKLLAKCVKLDVYKLPIEAKAIHKLAKGHPIILSLIGAALEALGEEARNNTACWKPYLDVLESKDYGNLKRMSSDGDSFLTRTKTIELCIRNLSAEMREKYKDFALFVEDVNIKTEVLEILWNLPKQEVLQILEEFHRKSLIVKKYNATLKCNVYGIHDLFLYHLKTQMLDREAVQTLHTKLISSYLRDCNQNLALLRKDDNYIYYYVGHHLANAKLFHFFERWYFNLDFIEGKLKVAGPADLLLDYKRYQAHFTDGSQDQAKMLSKLADFKRFVELVGLEVRRNHGPDIVQLGLQEPHNSEVYLTALRIAQSRPNTTYLRFQLGPSQSKLTPCMISTKNKITCACFSSSNNYLIVGFESGIIQIMTVKGYVIRVYEGHDKGIKLLFVCSIKNDFLSVSGKSIKVWMLPELDKNASEGGEARTPSPSQHQTDFTDMFNNKTVDKKTSLFSFNPDAQVDWATFSADGQKIAFCCSSQNKVEIWTINTDNKQRLKSFSVSGTSCVFSQNDELLIIGCTDGHILIYDNIHNKHVNRLVDSYPILALFALPGIHVGTEFGALTKATLCVWEVENSSHLSLEKREIPSVPCLREYHKGESETYTCCAAASDGSVVAIGTSSSKILVCDLSDGTLLRELDDSNGNIGFLAMDESKEHMLLGSFDDATLRLWTLGSDLSGKKATMTADFDIAWDDNYEFILAAPTNMSSVEKITGKTQNEQLLIEGHSETTICGISKTGEYIAAGTASGKVYLHGNNRNTSLMTNIFATNKSVLKLKVHFFNKMVFVAAGLERSIQIWKCKEEKILQSPGKVIQITLLDCLVDCYFISNEELVIITQNGCIKTWSLITGKLKDVIQDAKSNVIICDSDLSKNSHIITLDIHNSILNTLSVQDKEKNEIKLDNTPSCCKYSLDGKKIAVGFKNGIIQVRDTMTLTTDVCVAALMDSIVSVCVSDQMLVGAASKSHVALVTTAGNVGQAKLSVRRLVLSPDGATILTVDTQGHLHLIDDLKNPPRTRLALALPTRPTSRTRGKHSLSLP